MIRNTSIFAATFVLGALIALVARAAMHEPHADRDLHVDDGAAIAPMVSNALTPASGRASASTHENSTNKTQPDSGDTAGEAPDQAANAKAEANDGGPVNTICAICGMDVDPNLPTLTYQGKTIGFGCRMCPPKFKKNPDKYGPYYLRNELVP